MVAIRLMGDQQEVAQAVAALRASLDVQAVSRPYPCRKGGGVRVYVDARVGGTGGHPLSGPCVSKV